MNPSQAHTPYIRCWLAAGLAVFLGGAAIVLPALTYARSATESAAFAPLIARAVDHLNPYLVLPLLVLAGFLSAFATRTRTPLGIAIIGFASILLLPVWSALDLAFGSPEVERHNLLLIEWVIYIALGLFAAMGAMIALMIPRETREPLKR